mgnify:FL=1
MTLGKESVIVWWVTRIIMAGGMVMCGWILILLGRLARTGKYGRDDTAGIRTANTLASEDAWRVGHIRASSAIQVAGVVFCLSAAWVVIPYFSYYTVSIGFYLIAISAFAVTRYAIFVADRAAAKLLREKVEARRNRICRTLVVSNHGNPGSWVKAPVPPCAPRFRPVRLRPDRCSGA